MGLEKKLKKKFSDSAWKFDKRAPGIFLILKKSSGVADTLDVEPSPSFLSSVISYLQQQGYNKVSFCFKERLLEFKEPKKPKKNVETVQL